MQPESPLRITVVTTFVPEQSDPAECRFLFHYQITIDNISNDRLTLERRHWFIHDANGKQVEVEGKGVVGETPTLQPGQRFQYSSAAVIETPVGSMHGYFTLATARGSIKAPIAPFQLSQPGILH
ncbi:Co2+/Mg2+ efflux protein ApaG [Ferrimonas lipolytica]|uniref:Co2+/Mg2+ efflux protein ApaG n=1 Tax=Ferrimonas lipolytica TaxID=2724191 RepID=A0A6H1UHY1_9GAMM|nr:Co2+/Mg2+ efflux protein ApaG [Ferrimonas lipolytica]QIZ77826.1 Co2+/Mg2+ efflux protein ApaG [Ferrimonas lipolytica]